VHSVLGPNSPTATLDLRVDYFRTPPPDTEAVVRCLCVAADDFSITVQGFSTFGADPRPTAMVIGRFIVGAAPGRSNEGGDGFVKSVVASSETIAAVDRERERFGDFTQTLGASLTQDGAQCPALPRLVGAPMLPALHGGRWPVC
jgi:hypothetical protein